MATSYISRVDIDGLHGLQASSVELGSGLNIVHARNGFGKTTLLHVIANIVDGDLERFRNLRFEKIRVRISDGSIFELIQDKEHVSVFLSGEMIGQIQIQSAEPAPLAEATLRRLMKEKLGGRPVYLPAFRAILDAVTRRRPVSVRVESEREALELVTRRELSLADSSDANSFVKYQLRDQAELTATKTIQCRDWFGQFVPTIRYPSLNEINRELASELSLAALRVSRTDVEVSGQVFAQVLTAALVQSQFGLGPTDLVKTLANIRRNLEQLPNNYQELNTALSAISTGSRVDDPTTGRILAIYDRALERRLTAERVAFSRIHTFIESVNKFLESKRLVIESDSEKADEQRIVVQDGSRTMGLTVLSSGERQVLGLLFSATHMAAGDGLLLIDEPELSLHLSWQRILLRELMLQAGDRQVIVCTHAPELAAEHRDVIKDLHREQWLGPQLELYSGDEKENSTP